MNPSITIESENGWFRAQCSYSEDLAEMTVKVAQRLPGDGVRMWKPVGEVTLDGHPYHVLRDRIHEFVNRLEVM
ncbi:MAG TPA: hypothetical protein VKT80_06020 [Chloroflexota bacterium]|nr:hypothetical protein [Chloroflexota bacterium]